MERALLRTLLFDLDGVLIDSLPSITASMNHTLAALGRPALAPGAVRPLVGPPLEVSAAGLLQTSDPEQIAAFVERFREHYGRIYLEQTLPADGLHEVIPQLSERFQLLVATSKPEAYAIPILERLGIADRFAAIVGRSLALDHDSKAQVIGRALQRIEPHDPETELLMVGDRRHDVQGAQQHGISTAGMLHGMGSAEELHEAGARWLFDDLPALAGWLLG